MKMNTHYSAIMKILSVKRVNVVDRSDVLLLLTKAL